MATTKQIKVDIENKLNQIFNEKDVKVKTKLGKSCFVTISDYYKSVRKDIDDKRIEISNLKSELLSSLGYPVNAKLCREKLQNCHMKLNQLNTLLRYLTERFVRLEQYLEN